MSELIDAPYVISTTQWIYIPLQHTYLQSTVALGHGTPCLTIKNESFYQWQKYKKYYWLIGYVTLVIFLAARARLLP